MHSRPASALLAALLDRATLAAATLAAALAAALATLAARLGLGLGTLVEVARVEGGVGVVGLVLAEARLGWG